MKLEDKAERMVAENERLAREAERDVNNPALTLEQRAELQELRAIYRQMAADWAVTMNYPAKLRAKKEASGLKNVNANRRDVAADRLDEVRAVYCNGDSAEKVRRKIINNGGEAYPLRSIQRDLRKLRNT